MILPEDLRKNIEVQAANYSLIELKECSKNISQNYRNEDKVGKRLVTKKIEAVSYALSRMTATYAAIYNAIKYSILDNNIKIDSMLDVGAGTGAGVWVASQLLDVSNIVCIEKEEEMENLGIKLMKSNNDFKNVKWINNDITFLNESDEKYDLVLASYVLNEIIDKEKVVEKLWNLTNKVLLLIEPGTPEGYKELIKLRDFLINKGGNVIAPCLGNFKCKIKENDWCSFSVRVERSKIHRLLKDGESPFEDEKYFYMAISKEKIEEKNDSELYRILRHPRIGSGRITFKVCNEEIKEIALTKKNKEYKEAKKLNNGDILKINKE